MNVKTLYEQDFHSWINQHITFLQEKKFNKIDINHLIEELESMAKTDKRELVNRLIILIAHLLKWQYQPTMQSKSWRASIIEQRAQIEFLLDDVPSLKPYITDAIEKAHPRALRVAINETKLSASKFPKQCNYSIEQLLDENYYPDDSFNENL